MLLALLLAKKGVRTLVLEQHPDFSREYRGEVLMPRFTEMFQQLHLDQWLLGLPHLKLEYGEIWWRQKRVGRFDFSFASPKAPFALWMPQPILLNALFAKAKEYPAFDMWFGAPVKQMIQESGVRGVITQRDGKLIKIESRVVVGCDGRYSAILREGGFELEYKDHKFDVIWFTLPKPADYDNTFRVLLSPSQSYLLLPKYPEAIQVGILTDPHGLEALKKRGLPALKRELESAHPLFKDFAASLKDFSPFHPLQAYLHLVKDWAKDGCLLIGDAAHCCSPAGAIGVSVAVGSAIVAADVITSALKTHPGILPAQVLAEVQRTRDADVRGIHRLQRLLTGGLLGGILPVRRLLPLIVTTLARTPLFRRAQRSLMALPAPLPLKNDLTF